MTGKFKSPGNDKGAAEIPPFVFNGVLARGRLRHGGRSIKEKWMKLQKLF